MQILNKYFKPTSVTWWSAVTPITLGVFLAAADLHNLEALTTFVRELTGNVKPAILINSGLALIGLRAAQDKPEPTQEFRR